MKIQSKSMARGKFGTGSNGKTTDEITTYFQGCFAWSSSIQRVKMNFKTSFRGLPWQSSG